MAFSEWQGSRRQFLNLVFQSAAVGVLAQGSIEKTDFEYKWQGLSHSDWRLDYEIQPWVAETPEMVRGFYVNSPFIHLAEPGHVITDHDYPKVWRQIIESTDQMGANRIRILLNDVYEPQLGEYNDYVLDRVEQFAEAALRLSRGRVGVEMDLIDCYSIGNCLDSNPVYINPEVTSPYNPTKDTQGYQDFFEDRFYEGFVDKRFTRIGKRLLRNPHPGLRVVSVANEPRPPVDGREVNTEWLQKRISVLKNENPDIPLLPGVDRPWAFDEQRVDGLSGNTCHVYPPAIRISEIRNYLDSDRRYGLVLQEIGFPMSLRGNSLPQRLVDEGFHWYLKQLFGATTLVDQEQRVVRPGLVGMAGWKLGTYEDGFHFSEEVLPRTIGLMSAWNDRMWKPQSAY